MQDNLAYEEYEFKIEDAIIEDDYAPSVSCSQEIPQAETDAKVKETPKLYVHQSTRKHIGRATLKKIATVAAIVSIVLIGGLVAIRYAAATEMNYKNRRMQRKYDALAIQIQDLKVQIESQMSITDVAKIATERLNMQKPEAYQIVYIDAVNADQTVTYTYSDASDEEPVKKDFVQAVKYFLGIE